MEDRVQLLDIKVDTYSTKAGADLAKQYSEEEGSRVIYFVNSETLLLLQQNVNWKNPVEECELILPGNASVDASVNEVLGHKRDPFFAESFFGELWDYAIEMGKELLLVTENEDRLKSIQEHIHESRPYLVLSGMFFTEQEETLSHIVNEINSVAPDILVLALEEKRQLELLEQFRTQINAGLFLFTGDILYRQVVVDTDVPETIDKLNIGELYRNVRVGKSITTFFNNLKMKLKLKLDKKDETDIS